MSRNKKQYNVLKQAGINKQIIARPEMTRSPLEWIDDLGKYRDEHIAEYNQKKAEFMKAAQAYSKMNMETIMCQKIRLNSNYEETLDLSFLRDKERPNNDEDCSPFCCCPKCEPNTTGRLLRKRSIRPMQTNDIQEGDICLTEPWFKRYLILNKFIRAARIIIIQNRLFKVQECFKTLSPNDVKLIKEKEYKKRFEDYHCHPVFERFL